MIEKGRTFTCFKYESNNPLSAIQEDKEGNLWVGTWGGGLARFDRKTGTFHPFSHEAYNREKSKIIASLYADEEGSVWLGTMGNGAGYFHYQPDFFYTFRNDTQDSLKRQRLSNDDVRVIYTDRAGMVWIGTEGGLNRFDPRNSTFTVFKSEDVYKNYDSNSPNQAA